MKLLIMSDIHGNIHALNAVLSEIEKCKFDACVLLGDLIDYGMYSNEVIAKIEKLSMPIICNIWGNHEDAIINDRYEKFSSDRGRACAKFTKSKLNSHSLDYLKNKMCADGRFEFSVDGKKCLAVHGSLNDSYWKSLSPDSDLTVYADYDFVFSGHSHLPHYFEKFYACDNAKTRNKKKTVFINPGSVGQPRNLNNMAQCVILDSDTEAVNFLKIKYDISAAQQAYDNQVDEFYKTRLKYGV